MKDRNASEVKRLVLCPKPAPPTSAECHPNPQPGCPVVEVGTESATIVDDFGGKVTMKLGEFEMLRAAMQRNEI
jgi:hypothetical protein